MSRKEKCLSACGLGLSVFLFICAVINFVNGHIGAAVGGLGAGIFFLALYLAAQNKGGEDNAMTASDGLNISELKKVWKTEEEQAHIHGWDFSHIEGRYEIEKTLPWDYRAVVREHLSDGAMLLDYDTGGGEFLLSLDHPCDRTAATEGYPPNVRLCSEKLLPLGIDFRECADPASLPFADGAFDIIINRHGSFDAGELFRLLKKGGVFITEQVGEDNDRALVEMVLPGTEKPFPHMNLAEQRAAFEKAGFQILRGEEAFRPIRFFDVGAFVWFARVIEWEFPGFSVDRCFERLCAMQEEIEKKGAVEGTVHRYLIAAKKI